MTSPNFLAPTKDYTVQAGDSLSKISMNLYGTYNYYTDLARLNAMDDPNDLSVGEVIQVYQPLTVTSSASGSTGTAYTVNAVAAPVTSAKSTVSSVAPTTSSSAVAKSSVVISNILKDPKILIGIAIAAIAAILVTMPKAAAKAIAVGTNPSRSKGGKKGRFKRATRIQSYRFDRLMFTASKARAWLKKHKVKTKALDITKHQIRARLESPTHFKNFRVKNISAGVDAVIAEPKKGY